MNSIPALVLSLLVLGGLSGPAHAQPTARPLVLKADAFQHYVADFNKEDNELYKGAFPNAAAWDFLKGNIPLLDCPDRDIETTYYFRWWTYRKHIKQTPTGYIVDEFLPNVSWAGKYNSISCAAGHHIYEGRWLRAPKVLDDYSRFWFRGGGEPRRYSFWAADSIWARFMVTGDKSLATDLLPDLIANYQAWEKAHRDANGLYWQIDDRDGMEVSIGGSGYRATINSYQFGDALAVARIAELAGKADVAAEFRGKAAELKKLVQEKLWDADAQFFKVLPRGGNKPLADVRELHGFTPWYFNLPDPPFAAAWKQAADPRGFFAPFGLTTAEQRHPKFALSYAGHECQWNGPVWPYSTSVTLTGLANLLNGPPQDAIGAKEYFELLQIYAKAHRLKLDDGREVPWIDENQNPANGDWISRTRLKTWKNGTWDAGKGGVERGKDYNHSTFCDLVISGLIGLRARADSTVEVNPLVPPAWDYFCLDQIPYHGVNLTILFDKTGTRYGKGKGLRVFADGREIAASEKLSRVTGPLPAPRETSAGWQKFPGNPVMGGLAAGDPPAISGIHPHLAMFNDEGECGTGAVVPWAGRLWVVTYAPHQPAGSSDKLYEITPELRQIIRPESIGGTPANRMIHRESQQLFIGPYAIGADGQVRVISYTQMFGRPTGLARHLTDPANKIVFATMEEGIYEVDVKSLAVTELWADEQRKAGRHADLPGYHGKGFYSAQGRYVYANNGDHAAAARTDPTVPSGVLAEWDGQADRWTVVRRDQFTDVTGPGGLEGNPPGDDRLWSIGWDHRSLLLMLRDGGAWRAFRLPKASHCYDGAHGWNTEWPRIREIGEDALLMTMHGSFWKFPKTFSATNSAGIAPRSTYLKVVGDFCRWGDRIVLGCDDTAKSEFLNKHPLKGDLGGPGQSQSNLWFLAPAQLDSFGPALGRGAVWIDDAVKAGAASEPFLFSGYTHRSLQLVQDGAEPLTVAVEVDARGDGKWTRSRAIDVPARGSAWTEFSEPGAWARLVPARDAARVTAMFHYRGEDKRTPEASPIFAGLGVGTTNRGVLLTRGGGFKTLRLVHDGAAYDLDGDLKLRAANDPQGAEYTAKNAAIPKTTLAADAASTFWMDAKGVRWRLPRGEATDGARVCREVCTERNLLNAFGTFYEMPANNAGGFPKIRPVATHNRAIFDYASYRGLLVMSGVAGDAKGEHIIRSDDGKCALWVGAVDDLWQLGKPRGTGGPWRDSAVQAGVPSDPYLCTGYDRKRLTLTSSAAANIRIEADFTGTGAWSEVVTLTAKAATPLEHAFPASFGAYWLRFVADHDTTATATLTYE